MKSFLGFKEHYPEFYNDGMDQIGSSGGLSLMNKLASDDHNQKSDGRTMQFTSLKEFTIAKAPSTDGNSLKQPTDLLKQFMKGGQQNLQS